MRLCTGCVLPNFLAKLVCVGRLSIVQIVSMLTVLREQINMRVFEYTMSFQLIVGPVTSVK